MEKNDTQEEETLGRTKETIPTGSSPGGNGGESDNGVTKERVKKCDKVSAREGGGASKNEAAQTEELYNETNSREDESQTNKS
eukprot:9279321-Ditylum_brightwellii.AAC.1